MVEEGAGRAPFSMLSMSDYDLRKLPTIPLENRDMLANRGIIL
jgi:hypothetical protein